MARGAAPRGTPIVLPGMPADGRGFVDRFDLKPTTASAQAWFVTWAGNHLKTSGSLISVGEEIAVGLVSHLGIRYEPVDAATRMLAAYSGPVPPFARYLPTTFHEMLQALEYLYSVLPSEKTGIGQLIKAGLSRAPADTGVRWEDGEFYPAGVPLLDDALVVERLLSLDRMELKRAADPLRAALRELSEGRDDPSRLKNVIRDCYEALEVVARAVCGNTRELSGNREVFANKLRLSGELGQLLLGYVEFGNQYRHGQTLEPLPAITFARAEEFLYETGLLLRAAAHGLEATHTSARMA
jgi:hypothetical protein